MRPGLRKQSSPCLPSNSGATLTAVGERRRRLTKSLCVALVALGIAVPIRLATAGAGTIWQPTAAASITWNWQLQGTVATNTNLQMFDIDGFDNTAATITALHANPIGTKVICYIDVGSWEDYRSDAASFPASVKGATYGGFPNEKWLDIRQWNILGPIMTARFNMAQSKGCDGIEPDNVDGYDTAAHESSGFPLTYNDQIIYNKHIADLAHSLGMSVGLKNDIHQTADLVSSFDWALTEECNKYGECGFFKVFTDANKAVFNAEYSGGSTFCPADMAAHINGVRFDNGLDGKTFAPCGSWTAPTTTSASTTSTSTSTTTTSTRQPRPQRRSTLTSTSSIDIDIDIDDVHDLDDRSADLDDGIHDLDDRSADVLDRLDNVVDDDHHHGTPAATAERRLRGGANGAQQLRHRRRYQRVRDEGGRRARRRSPATRAAHRSGTDGPRPPPGTSRSTRTAATSTRCSACTPEPSVNALTEVASNNDNGSGGTWSRIANVPVSSGVTYQVLVDGLNGASGA